VQIVYITPCKTGTKKSKKHGMKSIAVLLTFCTINCFGQGDETGVKNTINQFFEGMRKSDTLLIKTTLAPTIVFQTIIQKKDSSTRVATEDVQEFLTVISKPHMQIYDERITFDDIKIDGALAMVWAPYKFYVGEQFSHCGVDAFQLVKLNGEWKIQYIIDTRRKEACP